MKHPSRLSSVLVLFLVYFILPPCRGCNPYSTHEEVTKCRELYEVLEKALVTDDNNIFRLKDYFVVYNTEILHIQYNVIHTNSSVNSSELSTFSYRTGYSMFGLFYIIDYRLLGSLITGLYNGCRLRSFRMSIKLNIANSTLQWDNYTRQDIEDTLDMITTRVS